MRHACRLPLSESPERVGCGLTQLGQRSTYPQEFASVRGIA